MALTLTGPAGRVSSADFHPTTYAGLALPEAGYVSPGDHLHAIASELRGMARSSEALGARAGRRPRLRLRIDVFEVLEERGLLPEPSIRAGREIGRIAEAVTRGRCALARPGYGEQSSDDQDGIPASLRSAFRDRYEPWHGWARQQAVSRRSGYSMLDITLLVCVEGLGQRQAADRLRMNQRRLLRALQDSLWWYVERAGWVQVSPAEAA